MSSGNEVLYIMQETDAEWVSPTPARTAIAEAVTAATDLTEDDLQELDAYIEHEELRTLLDGDTGKRTFTVEGYDVTITARGEITVS